MSDSVNCPFCGHVHKDLWDYHMEDEDNFEIDCDECGETFILGCSVSVDYYAFKKGESRYKK